jgi:hypothetical protein
MNHLLSPLRGYGFLSSVFLGLTPKAICYRHYVAEKAQLQKLRFGLRSVAAKPRYELQVLITLLRDRLVNPIYRCHAAIQSFEISKKRQSLP